MRLRIPAMLSICLAIFMSSHGWAQSGCARCVAPAASPAKNVFPVVRSETTRFRPDRLQVEDTPAVPSPFYVPERDEAELRAKKLFGSPKAPMLIPTDSAEDESDSAPVAKPTPKVKSNANKPTIAEKIAARYSDPRVVRMLQQLSQQSSESIYSEVSELIDDRHLSPATYARRVDSALDHVSQALEVPAFVSAAQVQGSPSQIAAFQEDLQQLRKQARVRNTSDAIKVLRAAQQMASQSISINPAAIGMEFLYGATDSLDQFSMLLPPEKNGGPSVGLRDNVVGIGVEIEQNPAGLKILKLIPGGPAGQADLRRGDIITHVDGHDLKQMELNRAVDYIVGPVGTQIQIQASRGGRSGRVTLTRQKIALHSVVDVRMEDRSHGIGYMKLEQFAESTMSEIDSALNSLHQQGMEALILDLRGNPGGLLTTAIALSDRFLPTGTIVSTRGRTVADNTKEVAHYANTWKVPLVVLVDHNSASASEIFAAAIQDNKRGLIVGEKSYGKGTVQTLFPLQTFPAALRLTTAKFYSPEGREMAGAGVTPDVKVTIDPESNSDEDPVMREALRRITDPQIKEMADRFRRTGEAESEPRVAA